MIFLHKENTAFSVSFFQWKFWCWCSCSPIKVALSVDMDLHLGDIDLKPGIGVRDLSRVAPRLKCTPRPVIAHFCLFLLSTIRGGHCLTLWKKTFPVFWDCHSCRCDWLVSSSHLTFCHQCTKGFEIRPINLTSLILLPHAEKLKLLAFSLIMEKPERMYVDWAKGRRDCPGQRASSSSSNSSPALGTSDQHNAYVVLS